MIGPAVGAEKRQTGRRGIATLTVLLLAVLGALVTPVVFQQGRNSSVSSLQAELATSGALLIAAEYDGNPSVGTQLIAGLPVDLGDGGRFVPQHTLSIFGSTLQETLCVEGVEPDTGAVWSYDMADGGLQQGACEVRRQHRSPLTA